MAPEHTISAISTPPGEGGIGIVRLSGPSAVKIASAIFKPARRTTRLDSMPTHTVHYGHIVSGGRTIDEALVNVMKAPQTYTREDIVEINCHGGIIPLKQTLALTIAQGARMANSGEFTERAFLNGRIDLSQAEAVADIINAKTEMAGQIALSHLKGGLKLVIEDLTSRISSLLAEVEASIEFPDENVTAATNERMDDSLDDLLYETRELISTGEFGKIIREGLNLAIVGLPNVGKSSLFNALTGESRVIVTPIAGTTRDIVEGEINIRGIPATLADTAGIAENSEDMIEREAVRRSSEWAEKSDLIIVVLDGSKKSSEGDIRIMKNLKHKPMLIAVNKSDLPGRIDIDRIRSIAEAGRPISKISAATGEGIDRLQGIISELVWDGSVKGRESIIITNRRHIDALNKAEQALKEARDSLNTFGAEIIALNLRKSLDALGLISGAATNEEILSEIFSRFCIGK